MIGELPRMRVVVTSQALLITIVVTAVVIGGCPGTASPVDTSQALMVEAGAALAEVDAIVEPRVTKAGQGIREAIRRELECPPAGQECDGAVDLYLARMRPWSGLVATLTAASRILQSWEVANDTWRQTGERPSNWTTWICEPMGVMVDTIFRLMVELELDVPVAFRALTGQVPELCSLGMEATNDS